ncbi:hypothetical protein [Brevundimonas goettingensis]|uniref:Uncharacterized protein n=1 Tax=Brevundimonas goettingensis TaxID=2774190 RepID=A0A975C521_9CAUL|nr:hypothetical protein [Brevundimonas goettingensis]QTC92070.1 hypothetical protein IFJ75_03925 [Brevundimonas goettingensis]
MHPGVLDQHKSGLTQPNRVANGQDPVQPPARPEPRLDQPRLGDAAQLADDLGQIDQLLQQGQPPAVGQADDAQVLDQPGQAVDLAQQAGQVASSISNTPSQTP